MSGSLLEYDESQHHLYADASHLDESESASTTRSVWTLDDAGGNERVRHPQAETVDQQRVPGNDTLYSRSNPLMVDARPCSQTKLHRNGSNQEDLPTTQPSQQSFSSHAPSRGNVLASHLYDTAALPLEDRTEAILFRHYIQKLAICVSN
jgi:hypothetical protein